MTSGGKRFFHFFPCYSIFTNCFEPITIENPHIALLRVVVSCRGRTISLVISDMQLSTKSNDTAESRSGDITFDGKGKAKLLGNCGEILPGWTRRIAFAKGIRGSRRNDAIVGALYTARCMPSTLTNNPPAASIPVSEASEWQLL